MVFSLFRSSSRVDQSQTAAQAGASDGGFAVSQPERSAFGRNALNLNAKDRSQVTVNVEDISPEVISEITGLGETALGSVRDALGFSRDALGAVQPNNDGTIRTGIIAVAAVFGLWAVFGGRR